MESEIPEVVVFLKASDHCQLLKDISFDGEVPYDDKCCVENCELDHNNISTLLKHELDRSTDVSEEVMLYISTGVEESFSNHYCLKDDVKLCGAQNKLMETKAGFGGSADSANVYSSKEESFKSRNVDASGRIAKFSLFQLLNTTTDDLGNGQQNRQDNIRDAIPADSPFSGQKGDCNISNAVDSRLEMDLGAESVEDEEDKSTKISGVEKPPESENIFDYGANTLKKPLLSSSLSHQNTLGLADIGSSSFSAASTSSGQLTFSGSVQCCDNISLRSNSTTSTTSFAFPILATEWNESPIRMAEVDRRRRRRSQKSTCWRMCFTCSNF